MPVISAFADHPTHPYVRVEINWADVPSVTHAAVYRVNSVTGECVPLRPYICYSGWELLLSCGTGTFWDTEAPFDTPFYYITTSTEAPCLPADPIITDTFTRVVAADWGATDTGQAWVQTLPAGATASVNGTQGLITVDSADETVFESITVSEASYQAGIQFFTTEIATGAALLFEIGGRLQDANNYLRVQLLANTDGTLTGRLGKVVGGVGSFTAVTSDTYAINNAINVLMEFDGNVQRLKWWSDPAPQPSIWLIETANTDFTTAGDFRVRMGTTAGNTNAPVTMAADNLSISSLCAPCVPVTATAPTLITIASDGRFWLKDPVRPCHDRPVPLCPTGAPVLPECGGPSGILFLGMGPEIYSNNSFTLRPMNRRRTMSATRPRSDATTSLRLQTMTFTDRDDLLALTEPGSLLLWQGPAEYGIPDRYMSVQPVQVQSELPDLRIQIRTETLPYLTEDRPAGPTQGICGARVADICDGYATWDALAATGMTWDDLVAGQASPVSASPSRRTWDDVNAEFVDWDAVNTGGRTWDGLEEGL